MAGYTLDPAAIADIESIARYTLTTWGAAQATVYERKLFSTFEAIANEEVRPRSLGGDNTDLFFVHCEHHYIFFLRATEKHPAFIVAVLHENMDLLTQIQERLKV